MDQPPTTASIDHRDSEGRERWRRHSLPLAVAVSGLLGFDGMAFGVALTDVRADLGGGLSGQVMVGSAFLVGISATLVFGGALSEMARWRTFVIGLVGVAAASVASAAAPVLGVLVGARLAAGVAAALVVPGTLSLVTGAYPPGPDRDKALARWTAWTSLPVIVGPPVAGWIAAAQWRLLPMTVAAIAVGAALWAASVAPAGWRRSEHLADRAGNVWLGLGLGAMAIALVLGGDSGWSNPIVIGAAVIGAVCLFGFAKVELHTDDPVMPPGLIRRPAFVGVGLATAGLYAAYCAGDLIVVYLRQVANMSAAEASLTFSAVFGALFVVASPMQRLVGDVDAWKRVAFGGLASACGIAAFGLLALSSSIVLLVLISAWNGLSLSVLVPALVALAVSALGEEHADLAASVNNAVARFARVVGLVIAGGVIAVVFSATLDIKGLPSEATEPLADVKGLELDQSQQRDVNDASSNGFAAAMITLGLLAAAGAGFAAFTAHRNRLEAEAHHYQVGRDALIPARPKTTDD